MYVYYVTYTARNRLGQEGTGYAEIERQEPIKTVKDVLGVAKDIKKAKKWKACTITNWTLMG